jgi:hypothetical protein
VTTTEELPVADRIIDSMPPAHVVARMGTRERLQFALYMQRGYISEMMEAALSDMPALISVPLEKGLKRWKGITTENAPDLLIQSLNAVSDEQVAEIWENFRRMAEFMLYQPPAQLENGNGQVTAP